MPTQEQNLYTSQVTAIDTDSSSNAQQTPNINRQLAMLKQHFPQVFDKYGKFIPDKMHERVAVAGVDTSQESYSLNNYNKLDNKYENV